MTEREKGLQAVKDNNWNLALIRLNHAARQKILYPPENVQQNLQNDLMLLDVLGEAAYRAKVPEALAPYQNYYKYPTLAAHMARAFLMLGDLQSCHEFLNMAQESALKSALIALSKMDGDIHKTAKYFLPVGRNHPELYYPEFWRSLAAVADAVGDAELTQLAERKSKEFAYDDPNIHFNQALRMLSHGEFQAGWRLYEWRLVPGADQPPRRELGKIAIWQGENLINKENSTAKTLLIYLEQGLGDCLFSLRYVQYFLNQKIKIQIVARPVLIPLIQSSFPEILIRNEDEVAHIDYWQKQTNLPDYWVYALSIPYRANLSKPQYEQQFLNIDQSFLQAAKNSISKINTQNLPIITINWHGRIDTESDRSRAYTPEQFFEIAQNVLNQKNNKYFYISIQKEFTDSEIHILTALIEKNGGQFYNAAAELKTFAHTAAFISLSERLLTCDTSVAHLGGALGHPTTVFVKNDAIWQWIRKDFKNTNKNVKNEKTEKSIWYDSVDIKYALLPEISWMIAAKKQNGVSNEQNTEVQPKENDHNIRRKRFNFAGKSNQ